MSEVVGVNSARPDASVDVSKGGGQKKFEKLL